MCVCAELGLYDLRFFFFFFVVDVHVAKVEFMLNNR